MTEWKEKKVSMGGAAIFVVVALFAGVFVGNNWQGMINDFSVFLGVRKQVAALDFSQVDALYRELKNTFDGEIDPSLAIEGAKRGLVESLGDRYTVFMNAAEAREFENSLSGDIGAGVGVELSERDGFVKVIRTLQDNPARRAGVKAGDIIYKVDGEEVTGLAPESVANKVRGAAGSEVTLTVVRGREELDFKMTREKINNVSAYVEYSNNTAIITILRFDNDTGNIVKGIANEINSKGINSIIVDLRGNGGGYVNAARDVLSLWIDGDLIMDQRSISGVNNEKYFANRGQAILRGKKTIVLTNGTTASAAEIMAGALRDYDQATIVGEKSYGKGSVQVVRELAGGNRLKVTIAKWFTPNGVNITGEGIVPDVEVERSFDDINQDRDPQLDRAKQLINE